VDAIGEGDAPELRDMWLTWSRSRKMQAQQALSLRRPTRRRCSFMNNVSKGSCAKWHLKAMRPGSRPRHRGDDRSGDDRAAPDARYWCLAPNLRR
jgi:hypothetical protein